MRLVLLVATLTLAACASYTGGASTDGATGGQWSDPDDGTSRTHLFYRAFPRLAVWVA